MDTALVTEVDLVQATRRKLSNSIARKLARQVPALTSRAQVLSERAPIYGVLVLMCLAFVAGVLVAMTQQSGCPPITP